MIIKPIKILMFYIKKNKWVCLSTLLIVYGLILPFFIQEIDYAQRMGYDIENQCFIMLQKFLPIIIIIFQSFIFQTYVEIDMRELINSLDHVPKLVYLYLDCLCFQILLIPFYYIINDLSQGIIPIILFCIFQSFVLSNFYYCISMYCKSSLLSLGLVICYCLVFLIVGGTLSLFVVDGPMQFVDSYYYVKFIIISITCVCIGRYFERKY